MATRYSANWLLIPGIGRGAVGRITQRESVDRSEERRVGRAGTARRPTRRNVKNRTLDNAFALIQRHPTSERGRAFVKTAFFRGGSPIPGQVNAGRLKPPLTKDKTNAPQRRRVAHRILLCCSRPVAAGEYMAAEQLVALRKGRAW